jgi:hypothetical protein
MGQTYASAIASINRIFKPASGKSQAKTILVSGKPGIGKTALAYNLKAQYEAQTGKDFRVIKVKLADYFAEDFGGIPQIDKDAGTVKWYAPDWLPLKGVKQFEGTHGILLLDEVNRANPQVLQAVMKVLDRDGFNPNWLVICTGNLGYADGTNVETFDSAQTRRFFPIHLEHSLEDWTVWARSNNLTSEIIQFLQASPQYLHYEFKDTDGNVQYITPAHWEELHNMFDLNDGEDKVAVFHDIGFQHLGPVAPAFGGFLASSVNLGLKDVFKIATDADTRGKFRKLERSGHNRIAKALEDHFTPKGENIRVKGTDVDALVAYLELTKEEGGEELILDADTYVSLCLSIQKVNSSVIGVLQAKSPKAKALLFTLSVAAKIG